MGGHLDGKGKAKHGLKTQGPQLHHPKGDLIQDAESRTQLNAPNFVEGPFKRTVLRLVDSERGLGKLSGSLAGA
ncbi:hypothetical protein DdX_04296 [Ditylenchus destructor]|uniref:Uncharacterized protein n=1 Tax=Ditylenchus destructor TaxID=166010 RepID=A0AAD4RAM9_9BILA|nr:hypothetical protein DdX_04296 [Ditylenchus destructor]